MSARLTSLQAKQGSLNAKIQQQLRRPSPCWLRLQALKRQRLRVEDKISANRRRRAHSHMVAHDNVK